MKTLLVLITAISCARVIVSPYKTSGQPKSLDHSLKLVKTNMKNSGIFWDLDYNGKNYRIRNGRYYLDMSPEKDLKIRDGANEMAKYNEEEKIKEIRELIKKEDDTDKDRIKGENASGTRKNTARPDAFDTSKSAGTKKPPVFNDPIVPKEGGSLTGSLDPAKEYALQLIESDASSQKSNLYGVEDMFKGQYQSNLKEDEEETTVKDIHTDTKPKIELAEGQDKASMLGTVQKSNGPSIHRSMPTNGYAFSLIPVFMNKMDKRMLIMIDGWCLTDKMVFRACEYPNFWNLDDSFYWDIFKAEDINYLNKIVKSLIDKTETNSGIKRASYIDTNACTSLCPDGECDTDESDDEDSDYLKVIPYNTPNRLASPQTQGPVQPIQMGIQSGYYPGIQPMHHSRPFSRESAIVDPNLFEKLRQTYYDRTTAKN